MMDGSTAPFPAPGGEPTREPKERRRSLLEVAREVEAGFQRANAKAIQKAHAAGIAVPVLEDNGDGTLGDEVVWLHPDGVKRATSEPVHARQHR